jgi:hypothetical protein
LRPTRRLFVVPAAALVLAGLLAAAPASAVTDGPSAACNLLQSQRFLASISGAGETALRIRCGQAPGGAVEKVAGAGAAVAPQRGADILVNNRATDTYPHITQSETTLASSGTTILTGYNDSGQFLTAGDLTGYARSADGGATWTDMGTPTTPLGAVNAVFGDPVLAADRARLPGETRVFYFSNLAETASGKSIISVHKTVDGGLTWASAADASPLAASADFQDKEWLAVDTRRSGSGAGNVYVCWSKFSASGVSIRFSRSTDGGATFTQLASGLSTGSDVQGCQIAVDPRNGNVYLSWTNRGDNPRTIRFRRSVDFGVTFQPEITIGTAPVAETSILCGSSTRNVILDSEAGNTNRAIRSTSFSSLEVNPVNGEVYAVWHAGGQAGGSLADIAFTKSTNAGVTWSPQVRINSAVTGFQFFAELGVNKVGKLRVAYYSTQLSATNRLIDVYSVQSTNGGVSFTAPARVTDVSFDRPQTNPNFDSGGGLTLASCYMGDYNDVSAPRPGLGGKRLYVVWGDNRLDGDPAMGGVQPDPDVRFDT